MPGDVFLRGDLVTLRTVEEADLDHLKSLVNHPGVRRSTTFYTPTNAAQERDWFENAASSDDTVSLTICADDSVVGSIGLHPVNHPSGEAEIGLFVDPDHWGNGYGTDASRVLTDYAFDELRKHRVVAWVYDFNDASKRIWEKLGYRHEATHRDAAYRDGEYVDTWCYAVLEDEWRNHE